MKDVQETSGRPPRDPAPAPLAEWGDGLPLPAALRGALERGRLDFLAGPAQYPIPARIYGSGGSRTPVLVIHGLQSHSGWFAQSAAFLGELGHPCYALDRCGSGLSTAPRGEAKDYRHWTAEIATAAQQVRDRHGQERVYLLGHCFGAIPAALFAERNPEWMRGLLLATPGLHTRITLPPRHLLRILLTPPGRRGYRLPVPLQSAWFSDLDEYRAWIASDPIALRRASGDFYWQLYRARSYLQANRARLVMPVWLGIAAADPIADNVKNLAWAAGLPSARKTVVRYPAARHILEFSRERDAFFKDLAAWLAWVELL